MMTLLYEYDTWYLVIIWHCYIYDILPW